MNTSPRAYYWLAFENERPDTDAQPCVTLSAAKYLFAQTARELARYGQAVTATIHIARMRDEIVDYPDFVLSLGPRGGVRCEAA